MSNDFYAKGTIKVRNQDYVSVPFMPNTDTENVVNDSGNTLKTVISNLEQRTTAAAQKGGIKVMYEEPDAENTTEFSAKTLIGYVLPEEWKFTVNTEASQTGSRKSAVPLNLFGQINGTNAIVDVDWGDGTTSTLQKSQYTAQDSSASVHEYAEVGTYQITVTSQEWRNLFFLTYLGSGQIENDNTSASDPMTSAVYWFRRTLVSVDTPLPKMNGRCHNNTSTTIMWTPTNFNYIFLQCTHLQKVCADLFIHNTHGTNFAGMFAACSSLEKVPVRLYKGCTECIDLRQIFYGCSLLQQMHLAENGSSNIVQEQVSLHRLLLHVQQLLFPAGNSIWTA